ncbi:hypothetical protein SAMD00019534_058360, partial [Acytostelium subglobosum LB1]|uniref:hypothetical protein n=1 Tax=Acytostelium subglobosum LB1 TaxID=1410327 RepID=UPI000644D13E
MLRLNKLIPTTTSLLKSSYSRHYASATSSSNSDKMTPQELIVNQIKSSPIPMIKVSGSDIDGVLRGKYLQKDKFTSSVDKGFGFCSVIFGWDCGDETYDNVSFTGNHTGYPDITAKVDLSTFREVPWENNIPSFLVDFYKNDGTPLPICPRNLLKKVIADCRAEGFDPMMGMEFEWYNYSETNKSIKAKNFTDPIPLTPGMFGYSMIRISENSKYMEELANLKNYGIPLEGLHTETGPGVYEVAINYSKALEAADRAILFKLSAKEIAAKLGIMASFMAKPSLKLPGCSGHMHQNFADINTGVNLFHDKSDPNEMSPMFKSFLAGQLELLPEFLPFFAPTINSYKRLVDGYWAPTTPTWSVDNRTVAIRVIKGGKATRSEFRVTGSDVNPYIAIAASFAAGLWGVKNKMELKQKPVVGNSYDLYKKGLVQRLPRSLSESTEVLAKSKVAREILGAEFVDHFVNTRRWEYRQFNHQVHRWEHERYFEII